MLKGRWSWGLAMPKLRVLREATDPVPLICNGLLWYGAPTLFPQRVGLLRLYYRYGVGYADAASSGIIDDRGYMAMGMHVCTSEIMRERWSAKGCTALSGEGVI